jgi:hypothetical protein
MKELNLSLHTGAATATLEDVSRVKTPEPERIWRPIPHGDLLEGVRSTLERSGLEIVAEAHGLARDGAKYFGLLQVRNGHRNEDFDTVIGLRNSHDKSFPAGLTVGSGVFVCDNLAFSGEIVIARKHTTHIGRDLPQLIESAMGRLGEMRHHQDERIGAYKTTRISDAKAHDLVVQALDARVLPVTRIPAVLEEWRKPRHTEFTEGGKTAWRLMNAFTEILKGASLFEKPRATQALHGLLDTACKVMAN